MSADETSVQPPWLAGAWTARHAADLLGIDLVAAERTLDAAVVRGDCTRVTCGTLTAYVPIKTRLIPEEEER